MKEADRVVLVIGLALLLGVDTGSAGLFSKSEEVSKIREDSVVREVTLTRKGKKDAPVKRSFDVVVLENRYLAITVCPLLGERIFNVYDKLLDRKFLYEGMILYSGSVFEEGGGSGGGLQVNHPYYHAGSSYVTPAPYTTSVLKDGTAVLILAMTSYPHLQRTVWQISLRPDEAAFHLAYRFENLSPYSMGFNPWINAAYPTRKDIQYILPAEWIADHWFGINEWKSPWGGRMDPWPIDAEGQDQSYIMNRKWNSAFGYGVTEGYSAIYYHELDAGFIHVFDPNQMPAAKAAGAWNTNNIAGWCEVWGAFSHNMEDPLWTSAHETIRATDMWFPIHGTHGMTWANEKGAVNLTKEGAQLKCGVYGIRDYGHCALRVTADGNILLQTGMELGPGKPFFQTVACPEDTDEVRLTVLDAVGNIVLERHAFFAPRPKKQYVLPEKPWHRRTLVTQARWQEAFTPMMAWGPWYHPPTTYTNALAADPNDVEAMIGRARSLIKEANADLFRGRGKGSVEDEWKEARGLLTKLAEAKPVDPQALLLLGFLQIRQGENAEAVATLSRLAGTPDDREIVHYQLGLLAAAAGDWKKAVDEGRKALALAPDSTLARLFIAIGLLKTDHPDEVREILAPVLEANPLEIGAIELMRRVAEKNGKQDEVKRFSAELARLAKLAPGEHKAGLAQLTSLESGKDLDCYAIDTTHGPDSPPGTEP